MATILELRASLEDAQTLKLISQAFTEAAAARVQKIKGKFEENQQFYTDISRVFHLVRTSGKKLKLLKEKNAPEKILSVALTSNQRFYGNINITFMNNFKEKTTSMQTDRLVIGATGKDFFKSSGFDKPYETLSFAKDNPSPAEIQTFLTKTAPYDKVFVYFPKFVTLMRQNVAAIDISQAADTTEKDDDSEFDILFEPEYSQILEFFQTQVRQLLFVRVLMEADLSRTAARMISMSAAEDRSSEIIKQTALGLKKLQSAVLNAKLLETFAALKGVRKN